MVVSLFSCATGSKVVVTKVSLDKALVKRLFDLGLRLHREVSVVHRSSNGNMVISTGSVTMAIDSYLTRQVLVQAA